MENNIINEIFLIINTRYLNIIKEIKEKLLEYNIKLNIYKKDDEFKKLLVTDTIVILDSELILDYGYIKQIEMLVKMKRAVHLFKLDDIDLTDIELFFSINDCEIKKYLINNKDFLFKLVINLKTFKYTYHLKNSILDKKYCKDRKFIQILEYILKKRITDKELLKEIVALSSKEFERYYQLIENLFIVHMTDNDIKELLPFIYNQVFKKMRTEISLSSAINELYYQKEYLQTVFNNITIEEFYKQYDDYIKAVKYRKEVNNTFVDVLIKIEVVRVIDGEIRNILKEKEISTIKEFIIAKYIKDERLIKKELKAKLYINFIDDIRLRQINDFHNINNFNIVSKIKDADIIISFITKKSLYEQKFINNIRKSIELNKKVLFVHLDKCNLNLSIQYLIGFSDSICYWAYKRIDMFLTRYYNVLIDISKKEQKHIYKNVENLK